jgi:dihydrofolate reductase
MRITLIAALAANGVIGRDNALPWHIPADLRRFKALTMGKPVIMGRRTFESIGRPLPGRLNIVMSRSMPRGERVTVVPDMDAALAEARTTGADEAMVIGGGEVFRLFMPLADRLELTEIHLEAEGDVTFPEADPAWWRETGREDHPAEGDAPAYSFVTLDRKNGDADAGEGASTDGGS